MYFNTKVRQANKLYIRDLMEYLLAAGVKMENYKDYSKLFGISKSIIERAVSGARELESHEKTRIERRLFEIEIIRLKTKERANNE